VAKILVVEDEIIVAWDIKETLEKLGHTVVDW
jgi:CheY-like chemotaxis protein